MLIPAVNSIGSGLNLCTVWVANIISLGLVCFMHFLLKILKLVKNTGCSSLTIFIPTSININNHLFRSKKDLWSRRNAET